MNEYDKECEELHRYLVEKLGRAWQIKTWRDKYRARLRKYGLATCKRAVDGFCTPPDNWYMRTVGHRAPELIFRSDKALEIFLANAPEESSQESGIRNQEEEVKAAKYRQMLDVKNAELTRRFHAKIVENGLADRICEQSWLTWIEPLRVVGYENGTVVLYHETARWVQEHYAGMIAEAIGKPVRVVNEVAE